MGLFVTAIGNIGSEVVVREAGTTKVLNFRMASNSKEKVNGEYTDVATWVNISYFGNTVDKLAAFLAKGKQVACSGELHERKYEKDGVQRTSLELKASNIQLLGAKPADGDARSTKPETGFDTF